MQEGSDDITFYLFIYYRHHTHSTHSVKK